MFDFGRDLMAGGDQDEEPRAFWTEVPARRAALRGAALLDAHYGVGPMLGGALGGGRGRKRRGDVRAAILLLLAEEPRNGYQLMQTVAELSHGRWRPSPGSVYPALAQLEDEGLVRSIERDGSKLLELTDAGRKQIGERGCTVPPWTQDDDPAAKSVDDLRSLVSQLHLAAMQVAQAGNEQQIARATETLAETRRALYRILAEDDDA
jgi:DNA-binding PadR family transcriptional regulator